MSKDYDGIEFFLSLASYKSHRKAICSQITKLSDYIDDIRALNAITTGGLNIGKLYIPTVMLCQRTGRQSNSPLPILLQPDDM